MEQGRDRKDQAGVADPGEDRAQCEDDGPVDDQVQVEQPVAQDGDGEQQREAEVGEEQWEARDPGLLTAVEHLDDDQEDEAEGNERHRQRHQPHLLPLHSLAAMHPEDHGHHRRDQPDGDERKSDYGQQAAERPDDVLVVDVEPGRRQGEQAAGVTGVPHQRHDDRDAPAAGQEPAVRRDQEEDGQRGQ